MIFGDSDASAPWNTTSETLSLRWKRQLSLQYLIFWEVKENGGGVSSGLMIMKIRTVELLTLFSLKRVQGRG